MRLPPLSFRTRLLVALIVAVLPVLLITLLVVRQQTERQVDAFVTRSLAQSQRAFAEVERIEREQLVALASRLAASNRFPVLLRAALFGEQDANYVAGQIEYELTFADVPQALVAFTDLYGAPVLAIHEGRAAADPLASLPVDFVQALAERGDTAGFAYHVNGDRLYSTYAVLLRVVDAPIGFAVVGVPLDDAVAHSLAQATGAGVCFVADGACVATALGETPGVQTADLVQAAGRAHRLDVQRAGHSYALVSDRLGEAEWRVLALPIDGVTAPFAVIQDRLAFAGLFALALAMALAVLLSRSLARPIGALVKATTRVSAGDYDVRVDDSSRDELGTLARTFNEMTHGLMLKERYRGVLDKVVSREIADELLKGDIALGGESRRVTTLFADIRGFTAMTQRMQPQDVVALVNAVLERASAAVEAEGGVVDKYVGDEIMAVFGAPIAHDDDPQRALRAGLRIRSAVAELSDSRREQHAHAVEVGIGICTGEAVAGNMGSTRRLNYTVLGQSVNTAARLCQTAGPGEILIDQTTHGLTAAFTHTTPTAPLELKGYAERIQAYALHSLNGDVATPSSPARSGVAALTGALLFTLAAAPGVTHAQHPLWGITNDAGTMQLVGSAHAELSGYVPGDRPPWLIPATEPFLAPRVSAFADAFLGDIVHATLEVRIDRGEAPTAGALQLRIEQLVARVRPGSGVNAALHVGKMVTPFGGYAQRHHTPSDPLIRPPLAYDWRTILSSTVIPAGNDGFIDWKNDPAQFRAAGAPPIWGIPYQLGAMLTYALGAVEARGAVMNSAPSSEPAAWDRFDGFENPSFIAGIRWQPAPSLRLAASYNTGPYLAHDATNALGYRVDTGRYAQELWGLHVAFARGPLQLDGELLIDRWDVPNVLDDPREIAYHLEASLNLSPGLHAAARFGEIRYNEIARNDATREPWDYDTRRLQLGAGYAPTREWLLKAEVALTSMARLDPDDNLLALQASWRR